ncbi:multiheme c-type cytochrome [Xanthomonadaceae bacterium XH05]|nr:multiheme c-type cytochrome [Xanthomonadaceae bacterium XH05]
MFHDVALIRATARTVLPAAFALLVAACSAPDTAQVQAVGEGGVSQTFLPLPGSVDHVGAAVCGQCHQQALQDWQGSHHDLAMQPATPQSVLGDFEGATFDYAGTTTEFRRRGRRYFVFTDGPDGEPAEFEILYTFGHRPLQQYLIELPGGRLQAFGIAWDSRDAEAGGQRWFHLYPDQQLAAGHRLHWTGPDQNWNFMCAECHSTGLKKNYDADSGQYDTQWAEIDVACEACHGPGLAHAQWAVNGTSAETADKALAVSFHERAGVEWTRLEGSAFAVRSEPRTTRIEIDACGRCHGRANRLLGDLVHGRPLLDSHRPALLDPDQYWPDGQMLGEVFNWGPFLQSRMYQAGVTCSDCHQPHSLELRAPGNALCVQCHQPARYDQTSHTGHLPDSRGSQCAACHMPVTTFMQVDDRHDHAFRIPRPDLSQHLGTPDACTACHSERDPEWAAAQLREWFPNSRHRGEHFATALHTAHAAAPGSAEGLTALISDSAQPAIVRASALRQFAPWLRPDNVGAVLPSLEDADPLVRLAAVETLANLPPSQRSATLGGHLRDPVRAVRMEAASALVGDPERALPAGQRPAFEQALAEYAASLQFNLDRPDTAVSLGDLKLKRGAVAAAEQSYRHALGLDPAFTPAHLHLADLARSRGQEHDADRILRTALEQRPDAAELHHALGLSLVRQRRLQEALIELQRAAELAPAQARYTYVLAVALNDGGQPDLARDWLNRGLEHHPYEIDLLRALAIYELEAGNHQTARALTQRLLALDRNHPDAHQLLQWIERHR